MGLNDQMSIIAGGDVKQAMSTQNSDEIHVKFTKNPAIHKKTMYKRNP